MVVALLVVFFVDFVVSIGFVIQRYQKEVHLSLELNVSVMKCCMDFSCRYSSIWSVVGLFKKNSTVKSLSKAIISKYGI